MPIRANFDINSVEYFDDDVIKVGVILDSDVVSLNRGNLRFEDIELLDAWIESWIDEEEKVNWDIFFAPEPEKQGTTRVSVIGKVFPITSGGLSDEEVVQSDIISIDYNSIEPVIVSRSMPSTIISGLQSVYFDISRDVTGLTPQGIDLVGYNVGDIKLYSAPTQDLFPGQRPLPVLYTEYNNSDIPRRYFRIDFEFPYPAPVGDINIELAESAIIGYAEPPTQDSITTYGSQQQGGGLHRRSSPQQTQNLLDPSITMRDQQLFLLEDFNVSGVINRNGSANTILKVYVEGLLRGWDYTYNTRTGVVNVFGDKAHLTEIEDGIWDIIVVFDQDTGTVTLTEHEASYDTGENTSTTQIRVNTPLNFGEDATDADITKDSSNIYRVNNDFEILNSVDITFDGQIQFTGGGSRGVFIRYSDTPPSSGNYTTHGTDLASINASLVGGRATDFTVSGTITNPTRGVYFWAYITGGGFIFISDIRMTVDIGYSVSEQVIRLGAEVSEQVNWAVTEKLPVITNPGTQEFTYGRPINLEIPISNNPSGLSLFGLYAGIDYEHIETEREDIPGLTTITGVRVIGVSYKTRIYRREQRNNNSSVYKRGNRH